jgi:glutamate N-acetyltransferase/amino-acid N-acetyltransferase
MAVVPLDAAASGHLMTTTDEGARTVEVTTGDGIPVPLGFLSHVANVGIKDDTTDFSVLAANGPCVADAVFTRSRFAGPSVAVSRRHLAAGRPRSIVTVSKNANVATGEDGLRHAVELAAGVARVLGGSPDEVLVASTGVIGRPYPMERLRAHLGRGLPMAPADLPAVARAIMTTDTVPKLAGARVGPVTIAGVAKGVGMIEPDMATMLAYLITDAEIPLDVLQGAFRRVVDRTFNCLSVDTDTSTSDTAVILANGVAGRVDPVAFEAALLGVAESLVRQLARDGEGATKLLQVTVTRARDVAQARRVAKAVVNSPLVKTAVHGADPNWGRVVMAVGKCSDDTDIRPESVRVGFGPIEAYPGPPDEAVLAALAAVLRADEVEITVSVGTGDASARVWGCDLSDGYVRINADYTT